MIIRVFTEINDLRYMIKNLPMIYRIYLQFIYKYTSLTEIPVRHHLTRTKRVN